MTTNSKPTDNHVPAEPASHGKSAAVPVGSNPEVDAVVRAIGFIYFNTVNDRWFSTADCSQTIMEAASVITTVLTKIDRLRFTISNDEIKVNGDLYEANTPHVRGLVQHLSAIGGCNFTFAQGITVDEFGMFLDLISCPTDDLAARGDFTDLITKQNFPHITSRKVVLREVSDEDVVVAKDVLESVAEEEKGRIKADVLALLSTERGQADQEKTASLRKAVQDTGQMAEFIMQAVQQQGPAAGTDKAQVARMVVECLDRAFDALLEDPFSKTQKGKKAIANALQHLESELLTRMDATPEKEEAQPVTSAVERMTERLKMDSIVQDYSKKLRALEDSEKRILRFMKLQKLDQRQDPELEKKLSEEGVDVTDLHHLLASTATDGEDAAVAVNQLAALLERIDHDAASLQKEPGSLTPEQVAGDLKAAGSKVRDLAHQTQQKINGLVEAVAADQETVDALEQEARKSGRSLALPRRKMLAILGEVVQEICQPLSVISCSIAMMTSKTLGEVSTVQVEMLQLMSDSADRIRTLITNLERLAGPPKTLNPDEAIRSDVNRPTG